MKIKKELIGSVMSGKNNGYTITVTIEDDRKLFKLYKNLGLDVFEKRNSKSESTEGDNK